MPARLRLNLDSSTSLVPHLSHRFIAIVLFLPILLYSSVEDHLFSNNYNLLGHKMTNLKITLNPGQVYDIVFKTFNSRSSARTILFMPKP